MFMAADHRGYQLKNALLEWLAAEGFTVTDLGPDQYDADDDYPDYAVKVAAAVSAEPHSVGIVICGSGVGMAVVAGKVPGIRAALIHDPAMAKAARADDDINVVALGADFISTAQAKAVVRALVTARFTGEERHRRRLKKIARLEHEQLITNPEA